MPGTALTELLEGLEHLAARWAGHYHFEGADGVRRHRLIESVGL